ncbi:MAG: enoyl-CoA hydratase/isomerase family protein [Litoreibacter sp.]
MIEIHKDAERWTLTLNRLDKANALTQAMLSDLCVAVETASGNAKVLVLTGAGNVFCAGADLDDVKAGLATDPVWERLSSAIAEFPGFSICALNGTLAGGAFGMALACDVRICVPKAQFFYPVMELGFLPQPSDPKRLSALIGPSRAKMILMGGYRLDADEAVSWGLVDKVVGQENLMRVAEKISQNAMNADASHINGIKGLLG